ncbi:hypothetical protein N7463_010626 [Penicillium fimorum]|uniref:Uncharacterized protein n=1 Tax=Penicillium fimorum TaxID=1882269 RepID=A0A9W9XLM0_9EURO|nr:hypothetical protein N7463_010626 [Penicillium fimorum]
MNTTVQEIACKSVELDGFGSATNDAWFDQHTAPMDGEEETEVHPYQAAALKAYLKGDSNPSETAAIMAKPHDTEKKTDLRECVFGIIEDALFELSESHTPALVALIRELNQLQDEEDGELVWTGLMSFGHSWSDGWKQCHWRKALATRDPATRAERCAAHVHQAFGEASCVMAALGPNSEDGLLPLSWGYECISEALECQDAVWDFEVPAAAVWIKVAGERLREGAKKDEKCWALKREGRLWPAGPMSMDRWNFWLKRLKEIEGTGKVILKTA